MKIKTLLIVGVTVLMGACATTVDSNPTIAEALPSESAEKYLGKVLTEYPIENALWTAISKCGFQNGNVVVLQPRMIGNGFKEVKRFPYSESYYKYQTSVPKLKESFFISKKDRTLSGAYSNKWCYLLNASKVPESERANVSKRTATALEAIGIGQK